MTSASRRSGSFGGLVVVSFAQDRSARQPCPRIDILPPSLRLRKKVNPSRFWWFRRPTFFDSIVVTAQRLESSRIVCGLSNKLTPDEQGKLTGDAWERLPEPKPRLVMEVRLPNGVSREYYLGPHLPRLRNQDLELLHRLWLEVTSDPKFVGAHHYHVIAVALEQLERDLKSERRSEVLEMLWQELQKRASRR